MSKRKGVKTTDGKRNMKILPSTFEALSKLKGFQTWDEMFMNLIRRSNELQKIEQSAMKEIYNEKEKI